MTMESFTASTRSSGSQLERSSLRLWHRSAIQRHPFSPAGGPRAKRREQSRGLKPREAHMRENIHPAYTTAKVHCACGATWETRSTHGDLHLDICSNCHPFFTGKQKLIDTQGRIDRFKKKYANAPAGPAKKKAAAPAPKKEAAAKSDKAKKAKKEPAKA